ncbi:MAG TPA: DegQ family serine endoprotease [Candidatus Acidoferrum sp.]
MNLTRKFGIWTSSVALFGAMLVGGVVIAKTHASTTKMEAPIFASAPKSSPMPAAFAGTYAPLIKEALPEVVNIASSKIVKQTSDEENPLFNDPFFRQFFGDNNQGQSQRHFRQPQEEKEQGLGSGVIVGSNGYILTNNHVVDGATDIEVSLRDKRQFSAKVVGRDPKTDIAVLKIAADHLNAIPLGDSSKVQVGDLAFAIGDPFGVGQTVTMGIVSATSRANLGIEDYEDFIQTDAAINPGNSGGALIDARGELIGINTAILSGSGGNQGVGFAIPVNLAKRVMDQIVDHGHVIRGFLGATIQDVTPTMATALKLSNSNGVLIADITPKGPAAQAGLKPGDVVLKMNGQPVADAAGLRLQVAQTDPGTTVPLEVRRGSNDVNLSVKLGQLPANGQKTASDNSVKGSLQGIEVEPLTPAVRQQLHLGETSQGVVISQLDPSSAAASAGLREGDVVQEVNHQPVTGVNEFEQAMRGAGNQPILLRIQRDGTGLFVAIAAH